MSVAGPARAVTVAGGFTATTPVTGLDTPTAAEFTPDGRLLVLEKGGTVRLWTAAGGLRDAPLLTIPSCTDSEMGLLGIAYAPDFAANGYVYLYHTNPPGGDVARCGEGTDAGRYNRVVRVTLGADAIDPASLTVLLDGIRTDGGNHDGGCLRFGPDGMLYAGVGETGIGDGGPPGSSTNPYAHDVTSLNGKILRLAPGGGPAPGNPFAAMGGNAAYVFAYGLRNPFRFDFDPITPGPHLLWAGDVGQDTWEEIDVVRAGDDMGWPQCEGPAPQPPCPGSSAPPVYYYHHPAVENGVAVTGGVHYDGAQFDPSLRGDYWFGDYGLDQVYHARLNATRDGFAADPDVFSDDAGQPVDFFVGPDGALYWVAIGAGAVVRVTQDGRPGAAIGACERALGSVAARGLGVAAGRAAACLARDGASCLPPASPHAPRRLARAVRKACDATARAGVCARLGCASCDTVRALLACAGRAAATTTGRLVAPLEDAPRGRCRTAAIRFAGASAGARVGDAVACADTGATACVPPLSPSSPSTRALARGCSTPPAALCTALACNACASPDDLAACVAAGVAPPADDLAATILGALR